jgi:hypothetical protein
MPSLYSGKGLGLLALLPAEVAISSSTNTSPIIVTTSTPHDCETGDIAVIYGHTGNAGANGSWEVVRLSATTLQLIGSHGSGVGGASGHLRSAAFGTRIQILADGDDPVAQTWNVAYEALADRTAALEYTTQYALHIQPGGSALIDHDAALNVVLGGRANFEFGGLLFVDASSKIEIQKGGELHGDFDFSGSALITGLFSLSAGGQIQALSGTSFAANSGGKFDILDGGQLVAESGGLVDIKGDGDASDPTTAGDIILRSGAKLEGKSGSVVQLEAGGTLLLNGATSGAPNLSSTWHGVAHVFDNCDVTYAGGSQIFGTKTDATATTYTGPSIHDGTNAYTTIRPIVVFGDEDGAAHCERQEVVAFQVTGGAGHLTDDRTLTLTRSPSDNPVILEVTARANDLDINTVTIKNESGGTLFTLVGTDQGDPKWVRIASDTAGFRVLNSYKASNG